MASRVPRVPCRRVFTWGVGLGSWVMCSSLPGPSASARSTYGFTSTKRLRAPPVGTLRGTHRTVVNCFLKYGFKNVYGVCFLRTRRLCTNVPSSPHTSSHHVRVLSPTATVRLAGPGASGTQDLRALRLWQSSRHSGAHSRGAAWVLRQGVACRGARPSTY